jgi:hypothetical protein
MLIFVRVNKDHQLADNPWSYSDYLTPHARSANCDTQPTSSCHHSIVGRSELDLTTTNSIAGTLIATVALITAVTSTTIIGTLKSFLSINI